MDVLAEVRNEGDVRAQTLASWGTSDRKNIVPALLGLHSGRGEKERGSFQGYLVPVKNLTVKWLENSQHSSLSSLEVLGNVRIDPTLPEMKQEGSQRWSQRGNPPWMWDNIRKVKQCIWEITIRAIWQQKWFHLVLVAYSHNEIPKAKYFTKERGLNSSHFIS